MSTIDKLKYGEIPQLTKGEQKWDRLYSYDAATAFRLLGEKCMAGKTNVLGSGHARPLKEYIEELRYAVSPSTEINLGVIPYPKNQVMYLEADTSGLEKDIGWRAETDFKIGILYHSIKITQTNFFNKSFAGIGNELGGLSFPEFKKIAKAFGYTYLSAHSNAEMKEAVDKALAMDG